MPIKTLGRLIVASVFWGASQALADIVIDKNEPTLDVYIRGTITKSDAETLAREETALAFASWLSVTLNSPGGDVDAAIRIGRILRKYDASTVIYEQDQCLSSCALIYIAGVRRTAYGSLGLHRPYLASSSMPRDAVQQATLRMQRSVQSYVAEMGISPTFYDMMARTDPAQMKILKGNKVDELIPDRDPVWDEVQTSYDARRYGVSTVEMYPSAEGRGMSAAS